MKNEAGSEAVKRDSEYLRILGIKAKAPHIRFLREWTWFDSEKVREFIAKGDISGSGAWARSAAHDVLHADQLKGLFMF